MGYVTLAVRTAICCLRGINKLLLPKKYTVHLQALSNTMLAVAKLQLETAALQPLAEEILDRLRCALP